LQWRPPKTGHLVLSALHTIDAPKTSRPADAHSIKQGFAFAFPPEMVISVSRWDNGWQMNITEFLRNQHKPVSIFLGSVALVLVGVGDYFATGKMLEFSVFFLVPISFFTWFLSRRAGLLACATSAAIILGVNLSSPLHDINHRVSYWNTLVWFGFFLLITFVIAQLKKLHFRERELSRVDNLTQVATRLAFYEFATTEINRARRSRVSITLAYVDLDCFKEVNDRNGHATGDRVLTTVAQSMQRSIRQTDMVARMGGDEFALIFPNTEKDAASQLLTKLLNVLTDNMQRNHWPVTFSIGAVTFRKPPESVQEMIHRADEIMYSVKESGKNRLRQEELAG
jgi:diguanylate cyclase (GGDEF)-like protein